MTSCPAPAAAATRPGHAPGSPSPRPDLRQADLSTFLLIWDATDAGFPPRHYRADIAATSAGGTATGRWSFGSRRRGTAPGDRVFLLRQRRERGIVGSGRLTDGVIVPGPHWTGDPRRNTWYAEVAWDRMVPVEHRLPFEDLLGEVPDHDWRHIYGGGQEIRPPADAALDRLWADHLADLGATPPPDRC